MTKARNIADIGSNDVLDTDANGVDVTGSITADTLTVSADQTQVRVQYDSGTNQYMELGQSGGASAISFRSNTNDGELYLRGGMTATNKMKIATNGDIIMYKDDGSTVGVLFDASTGFLGIGGSPASSIELDVIADAPSLQLSSSNASGRNYGVQSTNDGKFAFYDGTAGQNRMIINSSGRLGIDDSDPYAKLSIASGSGGNNTGMQIQRTDAGGAKYWIWPTATVNGEGAGKLLFQDATSGSAVDVMAFSGGNVGMNGATNPTSSLSVGGNSTQTLKPTVNILDTSAGASLSLRGGSPRIFMDAMAGGVPKILMDGQGIEFKTGTLDSEGSVDVKLDSSGNLLVGKASSGSSVLGSELRDGTSGFVATFKTDDDGICIDRSSTASNGEFIRLRMNGSTVGLISASSSDNLEISATTGGGAGLMLWGGGGTDPIISPMKEGTVVGGEVDLGRGTEEFRNIYLTNSVIAGGDIVTDASVRGFSKIYTGVFTFSGGGTQTVLTLGTYEMYLIWSTPSSYGANDRRHGTFVLAGRNPQTAGITEIADLFGGSFSLSGNDVQYYAGGGNPYTSIYYMRIT